MEKRQVVSTEMQPAITLASLKRWVAERIEYDQKELAAQSRRSDDRTSSEIYGSILAYQDLQEQIGAGQFASVDNSLDVVYVPKT